MTIIGQLADAHGNIGFQQGRFPSESFRVGAIVGNVVTDAVENLFDRNAFEPFKLRPLVVGLGPKIA